MEKIKMLTENYGWIAMLIIMLIEFFLGKTKLIKANSSVEAIMNGVASVLKFIFDPKKETPDELK